MEKTFLGTGWAFPVRFDRHSLMPAMVSDEEDIRQSLFILLSTIPGERLMDPQFGCDLHSQVFAEIDSASLTEITGLISAAVLNHEPRVSLESVKFDTQYVNEGRLLIDLTYIVRTINVRSNMVYPFYLIEGTFLNDSDK